MAAGDSGQRPGAREGRSPGGGAHNGGAEPQQCCAHDCARVAPAHQSRQLQHVCLGQRRLRPRAGELLRRRDLALARALRPWHPAGAHNHHLVNFQTTEQYIWLLMHILEMGIRGS